MRKEGLIGCSLIGVTVIILVRYSPDYLSLVILLLMILLIGAGLLIGLIPAMRFSDGFSTARKCIERAKGVQASSLWYVLQMEDKVFEHKGLDKVFFEYRRKVAECSEENDIICGIEECINEEYLALNTWNSLLMQIPNTLTALGILGTFIGLILGINNLGFSSVMVMKGSIESLLSGIRIAFYTSIGGVILSVLFNLVYNVIWDMMIREMELFYHEFHKYVIPKAEDQIRRRDKKILDYLEQIVRNMEK